jgi:hypothetical protein
MLVAVVQHLLEVLITVVEELVVVEALLTME